MDSSDDDFSGATRRLLFGGRRAAAEAPLKKIPGEGTSAASLPERHLKVKVTINLDGHVISFFKEEAAKVGEPYQVLINRALREYVSGSRPQQLAKLVGERLLADQEFLAKLTDALQNQSGDDEG